VVIANARLSERSAAGYRRLNPVIGWMLNELSLVLCQYKNDAARFASLGISEQKIHVTGSVKYDVSVDPGVHDKGRELRRNLQAAQPVWIAASTHEGEDERVMSVHRKLRAKFPTAVLILVPRHPERFESAYRQARQMGFNVYRRTESESMPADTEVFVVDTMGELLAFYAASLVAFLGGSLVDVGGHNPIEPGALGLPILMGPHVFNFEAICAQLVKSGSLEIVDDEQALLAGLTRLFSDPQLARDRGQKALKEIQASKGAVKRVVADIEPLLEDV